MFLPLRRRCLLALAAALPALALAHPAPAAPARGPVHGVVYTSTNDPLANEVVVYHRFFGFLFPAGTHATGGTGTGAGLGSQGALTLDRNGHRLLVVNAGSDSVSIFDVHPHGLDLVDVEASGGEQPISVGVHGDLVYVLNAGGAGNVSGFRIAKDGTLEPLAGSTRALSTGASDPAQVAFTPDGDFLVVTEKATDSIVTWPVLAGGLLGGAVVNASEGPTPFGFDFDHHSRLLVSEAAGGAPGMSSVSSYRILADGTLDTLVAAFPTGQSAACWVVASPHRPFAYVTNTGSDNVTGLSTWKGDLALLDDSGDSAPAGDAPIDATMSRNGRFLLVLNGGDGSIGSYLVGPFGQLFPLKTVAGLPAGVVGLAGL